MDGSAAEVGPGHVLSITPGHDAWTVGDTRCVSVDFDQVEHWAKG